MGPNCADFRPLNRKIVDTPSRFEERSLFFCGLIGWMGIRGIAVPCAANARLHGHTQYSFRKPLTFAMDGILSFAAVPMRLIRLTWLSVSSLRFCYLLRSACFVLFTDDTIPNLLPITALVLFLIGIQLLMLGIIDKYVARIYTETKHRPLFLIDAALDRSTPSPPVSAVRSIDASVTVTTHKPPSRAADTGVLP